MCRYHTGGNEANLRIVICFAPGRSSPIALRAVGSSSRRAFHQHYALIGACYMSSFMNRRNEPHYLAALNLRCLYLIPVAMYQQTNDSTRKTTKARQPRTHIQENSRDIKSLEEADWSMDLITSGHNVQAQTQSREVASVQSFRMLWTCVCTMFSDPDTSCRPPYNLSRPVSSR